MPGAGIRMPQQPEGVEMPNFVASRCVVTGPEAEVARFREKMFATEPDGRPAFDFNGVVPMPAYMQGISADSVSETAAALHHCLQVQGSFADRYQGTVDASKAYERFCRYSSGTRMPAWVEFVMMSPERQQELVFAAHPDIRSNVETMLRAK